MIILWLQQSHFIEFIIDVSQTLEQIVVDRRKRYVIFQVFLQQNDDYDPQKA